MGRAEPQIVADSIYRVAGPDISDSRDILVYLLDLCSPVLIDTGSGFGFDQVISNIENAGFEPAAISNILLTHCHFDQIGAASMFRRRFRCSLFMHELDAAIVERGDNRLTAAFCFGVVFEPLPIDEILHGEDGHLQFGAHEISWIHTPGHTPGSISLYLVREGVRTLFVQDIGAPLLEEFDCDPIAWRRSVEKLLALDADVLCDGHSGVYRSKRLVRKYFERCIEAVLGG